MRAFFQSQWKQIRVSRYWLLLLLPGIAYYIIFHYVPMYGVIIAFKDYNPYDGIAGSPWAANYGLQHFRTLFTSPTFLNVFKNTLLLSLSAIVFSFPAPILLALAINEVRSGPFRRVVQTVSYLPHFISTAVICGMVFNFLSLNGLINQIVAFFGGTKTQFMLYPEYFRTIYVSTDIWQKMGWNSIIYLATLTAVDTSLYEAADIDGAGRLQKIWYINIPCLIPTAIILLIFNVGGIMTAGFEKVLLLYNPNNYATSDIIGTYVYRLGIQNAQYSFSTAAGLFQSVINFVLVVLTNKLASRFNDTSLW
ncbi:ABC transporter permease subunit [Ruminococcaceae bacterium OttesenSCG-928-L11]|nr:ABC transporter permease subunit [Ruminococcaceae bacterium OttesenSCG-928-L11]